MNLSNNSLFLPRELFAPLPSASTAEPATDPFLAPFVEQRAPSRVDVYLPLRPSQRAVAPRRFAPC